jgi:predicted NodU family carbamoyl transferase
MYILGISAFYHDSAALATSRYDRSSRTIMDRPCPRSDCRWMPPTANGFAGVDRLLKVVRSKIPAVIHVDYSARLQTVDPLRHGRLYRLMRRFNEKTRCPVIINTSFNIRGDPIVCTPEHAYRCFMATNMDVLVLERIVLFKDEQPQARQHEVDAYVAQFQLD